MVSVGTCVLALAVLVLACIQCSEGRSPSHYCTQRYSYRVTRYRGHYFRCGWWRNYWWSWRYYWYWGWGYRWGYRWGWYYHWCYRTIRYYQVVYRTRRICCPGWSSCYCNVPVCKPPCVNKGFCIGPNQCSCRKGTSGSRCNIVDKCGWTKDCFPGTCESSSCTCASGYEGNNCQNIRDGAVFDSCNVNLKSNIGRPEETVFQGLCTDEDQSQDEEYWTNMRDLSAVEMNWEAGFDRPDDQPHVPNYIRHDKQGIIGAYAEILILNAVGAQVRSYSVPCSGSPVSPSDPHLKAQCKDILYNFVGGVGISHNFTLRAKMHAKVGGWKEVNRQDTGVTEIRNYTADAPDRHEYIDVRFDVVLPKHCTELNNCNNGTAIPPVTVGSDITPNKTIELGAFDWHDEDSGLEWYNFTIYEMTVNGEGYLEEDLHPIKVLPYPAEDEDEKTFDLPSSGMYSVILKVSDRAGNVASARGLVLYEDNSNVTTTDEPFHVENADPDTNYEWIHDSSQPLKVKWTGHFENKFYKGNGLLNKVKPLDDDEGIDDTTENRTISEIPNANGIVMFETAYEMDSEGGQHEEPRTWEERPGVTQFMDLNVNLKDGQSVVIWVRATDVMKRNVTSRIVVHMDSTEPTVSAREFIKNIDTGVPSLPYASSVKLRVHDAHSGISQMQYTLWDYDLLTKEQVSILNETIPGQQVKKTAAQCTSDLDCRCTPVGNDVKCYPLDQNLYINNCAIKDLKGSHFKMTYTIVNHAGLETSGEFDIGQVEDVSGQNEYPPPKGFEVIEKSGTEVTINWYHPAACYKAERVIVYYNVKGTTKEKSILATENKVEIVGLKPKTDYKLETLVEYEGDIRSDLSIFGFNTGPCHQDNPNCPKDDGNNTGLIVGIVIAVLLLILIGLLVAFFIYRRKTNKPAVPRRVRDTIFDIRNRFSRHPNAYQQEMPPPYTAENQYTGDGAIGGAEKGMAVGLTDYNVAYVAFGQVNYGFRGDEEDIYVYGEQDDLNDQWKTSKDTVQLNDVITTGRFAIIKKATLVSKEGKKNVAAKMLRTGASKDDKVLMKAKMNFMATAIPPCDFTVNLVAAVPDVPILLLELCEVSLKDWLTKLSKRKLKDEDEDNMLNFVSHISKAMMHIHEHEIVHRRLGARNVLLCRTQTGLVAKVTGFGPMRGEEEGQESGKDHKERIPIKWMAPESLEKEPGQKRIYNQMTDVWSFGITVWEIFSLAEAPYGKHKAGEIKGLLQTGYRLQQPSHCPEHLYTEVVENCWLTKPKDRPTFKQITEALDRLFHGRPGDEYYYDSNAQAHQNSEALYDETR